MAISTASQDTADRANPERSLELALAAARTAIENRGQDVQILDTRGQTPLFDYFVIATGTSRRQLHAMSEEIDHKLEKRSATTSAWGSKATKSRAGSCSTTATS